MSTSVSGSSAKRQAMRLGVLAVIGAAAVAAVTMLRSPLSLSEDEVRRMLSSRELVGLTLDEAAARLQQRPSATTDGVVVIDFTNVRSWRAGSVMLDVRGGKVMAASWGDGSEQGE